MLEFLEKHFALIASIITSLGVIFAARRPLLRVAGECSFLIRGPFVIRQMLVDMDKAVKEIRYQVQTNDGGSLKDAVLRSERQLGRLDSFRKNEFRYGPKPALELNGNGHVLDASEATCRLFRVSDTDELSLKSYLRFLDANRVNDFVTAFRDMAASGSYFSFEIKLRTGKGEYRGLWEFRATPIDLAGDRLYSGYFSPVDQHAKDVVRRAGWRD